MGRLLRRLFEDISFRDRSKVWVFFWWQEQEEMVDSEGGGVGGGSF